MEQPARQVSENQYIWSLCRFIRIYQIHFISILSNTFSNRVEQPYSRSLSRSTNCGFFFPFAREKKSTKFICPFLLFLHQTRESMSLLMRRVLPLTAGSLMIARHFSQRFFSFSVFVILIFWIYQHHRQKRSNIGVCIWVHNEWWLNQTNVRCGFVPRLILDIKSNK